MAFLVHALSVADPVAANEMINGGFEVQEEIESGYPTTYGDWRYDLSSIVTAENGIVPWEGLRMLKFLRTGQVPTVTYESCQVQQLVDLGPFAGLVESGLALVIASCKVNRIVGDEETDTKFGLRILSYAGLPGSFPEQYQNTELAEEYRYIFTDSAPDTWETITLEMLLPPGSDFILIEVYATENICNDGSDPEFDGHYADGVIVDISSAIGIETTSWGRVKRYVGN